MTIAEFDQLPVKEKRELLASCCGSEAWIKKMLSIFPVQNLVDLLEYAEDEWYDCNTEDWLEAFEKHIRIGDIESVREKASYNPEWAFEKEWAIQNFSEEMIEKFLEANQLYEETFGYNFIVAANEKSTNEVLEILLQRLNNDANKELLVAAAEQNRITQMRLKKLFA
jgi:2-oxo-4-hydroxy-4-carboxy-5-ureidoimidazoline decarboxylase